MDPYMLSMWKWLELLNSVKGPVIPARLWLIMFVVVFWSLVLNGFEGRVVVVVVFNCYFIVCFFLKKIVSQLSCNRKARGKKQNHHILPPIPRNNLRMKAQD